MKSLLLLIGLFAFSTSIFAQDFSDGKYAFIDEEGMLYVAIEFTEDGETISNVNISEGPDAIATNGTGYWFKVNMNGVEEDYDGPEGWYQFTTGEGENYELEALGYGKYKLKGEYEYSLTLLDEGPVEMTEGSGQGDFDAIINYDWYSDFYGLCFESEDGTTMRIDGYGADTFIGWYDESVSNEGYDYSITMYLKCVAGNGGIDLPVTVYVEVEGDTSVESETISLDFESYIKFRGKDFKVVSCE